MRGLFIVRSKTHRAKNLFESCLNTYPGAGGQILFPFLTDDWVLLVIPSGPLGVCNTNENKNLHPKQHQKCDFTIYVHGTNFLASGRTKFSNACRYKILPLMWAKNFHSLQSEMSRNKISKFQKMEKLATFLTLAPSHNTTGNEKSRRPVAGLC